MQEVLELSGVRYVHGSLTRKDAKAASNGHAMGRAEDRLEENVRKAVELLEHHFAAEKTCLRASR
jgi:hypothetical protein